MIEAKADILFEVSWEVCNKVGGIYTVIRSKSSEILKYYKNYFFIGPYFPEMAVREFYPEAPPDNLKKVIENLKRAGIILLYGRWLINRRPLTLLIDFSKFMDRKNEIKAELWQDYKIDSLYAGKDFDEPVVWATSVGMVLEELANVFKGKLVAHFHEWLSSAGILYIKKKNLNIKSVFTTHATVLGRSFAGANMDFYCFQGNKCHLETIDIEKEAYNLGVSAKHQLERASAERCDVFTTVSEITGMEAKHILRRSPDVLVPNGLDTFGLPNQEEIPIKHRIFKEKIKDFIISYFFPFYSFDLDNTLFYFLSGRYEFRNKGIDITIKALSLLNERLRKKQSDKTIVVFFFVPNAIKTIHSGFLESKALFQDIKDMIDDNIKDIRNKIIYSIANQKLPSEINIFDEDFLFELKNKMVSFKREREPYLCTHELVNENDIILKSFRENSLLNKKNDKVKVILYPCYLNSSDGLLDLEYYSVVWGCHLGIFPSYYEPWGYTPIECSAYGVSSITTDLSGLGRYLLKTNEQDKGVFVVHRENKSEEEVVKDTADRLYWFSTLSKEGRIRYKIMAENLVHIFSWERLVENYIKAHNLALEKI